MKLGCVIFGIVEADRVKLNCTLETIHVISQWRGVGKKDVGRLARTHKNSRLGADEAVCHTRHTEKKIEDRRRAIEPAALAVTMVALIF